MDRNEGSDIKGNNHGMENMNTIIRHFTSKIDQWESEHADKAIATPEQVQSQLDVWCGVMWGDVV